MATRILIVEDEASIAEPFARLLRREGFETTVARTAAEALEAARATDPTSSCSTSRCPTATAATSAACCAASATSR